MALIDPLLKLISQTPRATEQELSDEIHRVQGNFDALRKVHDSTNLSVVNLEQKVASLENELASLKNQLSGWAQQRQQYEQTIQNMTHNMSSQATGN